MGFPKLCIQWRRRQPANWCNLIRVSSVHIRHLMCLVIHGVKIKDSQGLSRCIGWSESWLATHIQCPKLSWSGLFLLFKLSQVLCHSKCIFTTTNRINPTSVENIAKLTCLVTLSSFALWSSSSLFNWRILFWNIWKTGMTCD